ncbi:hypothetical protein J6590_054847 [Homalodisca vitripennis]|nr:hypothetical protein J6590_054847 [Homalodisca vitripennis]
MGQSDLSYDLPFGRYRARKIIFSEKISGMSNIRAFCRLTMEDRAKSHWTFFVVHFIPDQRFFVRSELAPMVRPLSGVQKRPARYIDRLDMLQTRTTTTALHSLVEEVLDTSKEKQALFHVFMDIEGAFDRVAYDSIKAVLKTIGVSSDANLQWPKCCNRFARATLKIARVLSFLHQGYPSRPMFHLNEYLHS